MENATRLTVLDRTASLTTPAAVVIMEALWGYPWLLWAGKWETLRLGGTPLGFASILALVGISFVLTRFLLSRSWSNRTTAWTVLAVGLAAVVAIVRLEYGGGIPLSSGRWFSYFGSLFANMLNGPCAIAVALPASAYFWWRGMILGRAHEYSYVRDNIMFGAGSYVVLALIWAASLGLDSLGSMAGAVAPLAAAFFFCGLLAMALANLRIVQKRIPPDEPRSMSLGRWLPVVLTVVTVVVLVGVLIGTASSLDIVGAIRRLFGSMSGFFDTVGEYLGIAFQYILVPFEWLASMLFKLIEFILKLFGNKSPGQTSSEPAGAPPELPTVPVGESPTALFTAVKWSLFAIAAVLVAIIIMRTINKNQRHRREGKPDFEESRQSFWSWNRLFYDIILFLEGVFMPWRRKRAITRGATSQTTRLEETVATLKIREVFRRLLRDAAKAGVVWHHSETPFEYARRFADALPESAPSVDELTQMYVNVRYSTAEPPDGQVLRANSLWRQIRQSLKNAVSSR